MLKSIQLKNFRSHYNTIIPLKDYTSIVGPNGSGKSNIIEAIKFCLTSYNIKNKELLKMINKNSLQTENITETIVRLIFSKTIKNEEIKEIIYIKRIKAIAQLDGFKLKIDFFENKEEINEERYLIKLKEEGLTNSLIISQSSNYSILLEKNILEYLKLNKKTSTQNLLNLINKETKKIEIKIKSEEIEILKNYLKENNIYKKINNYREYIIKENKKEELKILLKEINELNNKENEIQEILKKEDLILENKENQLKNISENSINFIEIKLEELKMKKELIKRETAELIREINKNEGIEYLNIFQKDILEDFINKKPNILFRINLNPLIKETYNEIKTKYQKLIETFQFTKQNELEDLELNILPLKSKLLKEYDIQNIKYSKLKANYNFYLTKINRIKTELELLKEEYLKLTDMYLDNNNLENESEIKLEEIIDFLKKCNLISNEFKNDGSYKSMKLLDDCMINFETSPISNYLDTLKSIYSNKIFGKLINLIKFNNLYLKTINSSLNKYLDAIITDSQSTSFFCLKYLKESISINSNIIFLNISKENYNKKIKSIKTPTGDLLKPVIDLLIFKDEKFQPLINNLLINTYYIENFSNIKHLSNEFIKKNNINKIIGINGEVFNSNGLYTSYPFKPNSEIIEYYSNSYKQLRIKQKKFEEFDIKIIKIEERERILKDELNYYENIIYGYNNSNSNNKEITELERQELILNKIKIEIEHLNTDSLLEIKKEKKEELKNHLIEFKKKYFPKYLDTNLELLFRETSTYKIYFNKMMNLKKELNIINIKLEEEINLKNTIKGELIPKNELIKQINNLIESTNKLKNKILGFRELKFQLLSKENLKEEELKNILKENNNNKININEILISLNKEIENKKYIQELKFINELQEGIKEKIKEEVIKKRKLSINELPKIIKSDLEKIESILKNLSETMEYLITQQINIKLIKREIEDLLKEESFKLINSEDPKELFNSLQEIQKELKKIKRISLIEKNKKITNFLRILNDKSNEIYQKIKSNSIINLSINENNENPRLEIKAKMEEEGFMKIENLSGGEKDLIEWCLLFALSNILTINSKQIIIIDELDKHLDTSNLIKLSEMLYNFSLSYDSNMMQIINVSHKPIVFCKSKCLIGCYSKKNINIRDRDSWNNFYKEMRESFKSSESVTTHIIRETKIVSLDLNQL